MIKDVVIPFFFWKPDVGVTIAATGTVTVTVGVCVRNSCKCPVAVPMINKKIDQTVDIGEIPFTSL